MAASVHEVFSDRLADWTTISGQISRAESAATEQRVWMVPSDWGGDPFNIPGMHEPSFDRTSINGNYAEVASAVTASVGDCGSLKIQLDSVACMERAFRYRHASQIRCIMHAASRDAGHGNSQGVFGAIRNYAQDLISAGGAG
jgi:hypothetical protein